MAEALDPEPLRMLMGRYFDSARGIIERHGGTVEKFIGDAVMAVFGVPTVHEDDALRAVRAAADIAQAVDALNDDFVERWGVRLRIRTGVNTGEVVAGDAGAGHGFVAGEAVNVAARLEQVAGVGEVLVGEATYRLTRDDCEFAPETSIRVKGKSVPLPTWRLIGVQDAPSGARAAPDSPLVGRASELNVLEAAFERAIEERSCRLVTIAGTAGIGKSRLADELLARVGSRAATATGRCLPYGTITYWAVREVVSQLCDIPDGAAPELVQREIAARLRGADAEAVAGRVAEAAELVPATGSPGTEETFLALRRLLEDAARRRPLVIVFDDIHWGEPTFLDLLEYLGGFSRDAPMLIVCLARPDLLESRPHWAGSADSMACVTLDALRASDVHALLMGEDGSGLPGAVAERIAKAAEGNPLFLAEMRRMLVDDGLIEHRDGEWVANGPVARLPVPPSIHAVLAARLDGLDAADRALLQRASAIGRQFGWAGVAGLGSNDDRHDVGARLQRLADSCARAPDRQAGARPSNSRTS
jgi:class 3 adenylate cyclase